VWQVLSVCKHLRKVSITFVFKNGTGNKKQDSAGLPETKTFKRKDTCGATIVQSIADMSCNFSLGASTKNKNIKVTTVTKIDPNGDGSLFWNDLTENGIPTAKSEDDTLKDKKDVCVAVCSQTLLQPGSCEDFEFSLVWDCPKVKFPKGTKVFSKYYTRVMLQE
jgi:uncharacterized protein (DUF608 family)